VKEMLGFTSKPFDCLPYLIEWLFSKSETKLEVESNYFIIAECVGRLAFLSSDVNKRVISNAQAAHPQRRFVVASALRFALENSSNLNEDLLDNYVAVVGKSSPM
jgi:hypothetical protein